MAYKLANSSGILDYGSPTIFSPLSYPLIVESKTILVSMLRGVLTWSKHPSFLKESTSQLYPKVYPKFRFFSAISQPPKKPLPNHGRAPSPPSPQGPRAQRAKRRCSAALTFCASQRSRSSCCRKPRKDGNGRISWRVLGTLMVISGSNMDFNPYFWIYIIIWIYIIWI